MIGWFTNLAPAQESTDLILVWINLLFYDVIKAICCPFTFTMLSTELCGKIIYTNMDSCTVL